MHNKYIITYEYYDNALRMWKVVQLEKYFDFSLYSYHFSLLSLTSLLSAPEREVTSPSDFKVVGALQGFKYESISTPKITDKVGASGVLYLAWQRVQFHLI